MCSDSMTVSQFFIPCLKFIAENGNKTQKTSESPAQFGHLSLICSQSLVLEPVVHLVRGDGG